MAVCACGCGQVTPIATRNRYDRGQIKGQPLRYVPGHNSTRRPLEERFWDNVQKSEGCWLWKGSRDHRGYGRLQRGTRGEGHVKAHRLSYELRYGPIDPPDLFVCHRCDNPSCVNPAHLFLGTHRENMEDAKEKKRMRGRPLVLDVDEVLAFMAGGSTYRAAAEHFGVPTTTIWRYLKRAGLVGRK